MTYIDTTTLPADRSTAALSTDVDLNVKSFEYLGAGKVAATLDTGEVFTISGSTFLKTLNLAGRLFSKHSWDLIDDCKLI